MNNDAAVWNALGKLFIKVNSFDDAINAFDKALANGDQDTHIYTYLGIAYFQKGAFEIARGFFEKSLELNETDAEKSEILKWLGDLYIRVRKYNRAAMVYETADLFATPVELLNEEQPPIITQPIECASMTAAAETTTLAEKAKATQLSAKNETRQPAPSRSPWQSYTAPTGQQLEYPAESAPQTLTWEPAPEEMTRQTVTAVTHAFTSTVTQTATTPVETKTFASEPKEIEVYRSVTSANPTNDRAWFTLGNHLKTHNRLEEAQAAYETAVKLNPRVEAYHYQLGLVLTTRKMYEAAVTALSEVISLRADHMLAHVAMAGCCRRLGRESEMKRHADIATPYMQSESNYNRACFESICGNTARAFDLLKTAITEDNVDREMLLTDPDLDFIRDEPRFATLLKLAVI